MPTPEPTSRGCFGNLPFGLENCVCSGAEIGETAGLAACSAVFTECGTGVTPFSLGLDQKLESVQRACDSLAAGSCLLTGKQLAMSHPICADLIMGRGSCSAERAQEILEASLDRSCEPLCPECATQEELPSPTAGDMQEYPEATEQPMEEVEEVYLETQAPEDYVETPQPEVYLETQQPVGGDEEYITPEPKPVDPEQSYPENRGCVGNLPFGLEQCVCDGAEVGEAAGVAACSAVFAECQELTPFNSGSAPQDESAISRACDDFAHSTCRDVATQFAIQTEPCARLLFKGNGKCSADQARNIFTQNSVRICEPVCPECTERREQ